MSPRGKGRDRYQFIFRLKRDSLLQLQDATSATRDPFAPFRAACNSIFSKRTQSPGCVSRNLILSRILIYRFSRNNYTQLEPPRQSCFLYMRPIIHNIHIVENFLDMSVACNITLCKLEVYMVIIVHLTGSNHNFGTITSKTKLH